MRCSLTVALIVVSLGGVGRTTQALAETPAPWTAVVVADETPILSAPADNAYATDLVSAGTEVEVLRRDPRGWLAIRPTAGSFSWIPARKLRLAKDSPSAEIVADDAVAWIGSRVETVRDHKWLVRLRRGETVQILGTRDLYDSQTGTTENWCQIASPVGEMRWVHQADVRERRPAAEPGSQPEPATKLANAAEPTIHAAGFFAERAARRRQRDGAIAAQNAPSEARPAPTTKPETPQAEPPAVQTTQYRTALAGESRSATEPALAPPGTPPTATMSARQFDRELEDIGLQLSLTVPKDPSLWNLSALRDRAQMLVNAGPTPLDRGRARLMLDKIEEWEDLQRRHVQAQRGTPPSAEAPVGTDVAARAPRTATADAARRPTGVEPRFDGSGWLLPVHSTKRVAPPYALMDDRGQVVQYVSPAPGVNLHLYERKRVGIYGQKGTAASLNAPMITAQRIVDLERLSR